jgi:hypothetical protein
MRLSMTRAHFTTVTLSLPRLRLAPPNSLHRPYKMDKIQGLTPAKTRDTKPSSLQGYIMEGHLRQITAGCIVWLPAKAHILPGAEVDQHLNEGAFDHPAILVSVPCPLKYNSTVEFAIVSLSFLYRFFQSILNFW